MFLYNAAPQKRSTLFFIGPMKITTIHPLGFSVAVMYASCGICSGEGFLLFHMNNYDVGTDALPTPIITLLLLLRYYY